LNKHILFIAIAWAISTCVVLADTGGPADTVLKYYEASREGNVTGMRQLIAGSFYNRRKVLLEANDNYPSFLESYYQDSAIAIDKVDISNEGKVAVVSVLITYASQTTETKTLILKMDKNDNWVIADEVPQ